MEETRKTLGPGETVTMKASGKQVVIDQDGVVKDEAEEVGEPDGPEPTETKPEDREVLMLAIGPGTRVVSADDGKLMGTVKSGTWKATGVLQLTIELDDVRAYRAWVAGLVCGSAAPPGKPDLQPALPNTEPDAPGLVNGERVPTNAVADDPEAARVYDEACDQAADSE